MIEIQHANKVFPADNPEERVHAVRDVSLTIGDGEIYGIIGYSGAGKSTLVRLINRLEEIDSGKVLIDGVDIHALKPRELRAQRKKIGMIFQQFNLLPSRTVLENVLFPLRHSALSQDEKVARARELLELCGLADKANAYPAELSGGQKQRTGIARALASEPKVLLCDEATSALDPETTQQILQLLKKLNQELGLTIVLITHEMAVVKSICDKVAVMEKGRLVESGPVYQVFADARESVTRSFISSASNLKKVDQLIREESRLVELADEDILVKFTYRGDSADESLVSEVSRRFGVDCNIIMGDIDVLQDQLLGGLIVVMSGPRDALNASVLYLIEHNVLVEVLRDAKHLV